MTHLSDLIAEMDEAWSPSAAIDRAINDALGIDNRFHEHEGYTSSINAAFALVEKQLPGWLYGVRHTSVWAPHHKWAGKPVWEALLGDPGDSDSYEPWCDHDNYDDYDDVEEHMADHCHPALAVCVALLRALQSKTQNEDGPKQVVDEVPNGDR